MAPKRKGGRTAIEPGQTAVEAAVPANEAEGEDQGEGDERWEMVPVLPGGQWTPR